jgi:maltose O-acetyltransferase
MAEPECKNMFLHSPNRPINLFLTAYQKFKRNNMSYLHDVLRQIYQRVFRHDLLKEHIKRGMVVGKNFNMQDGVIIDYSHTWHIEIGDNVTLAPRVHILAHDASTKMHLGYTRIGKVKIGHQVFIGASAIILPGVTIGDNVIVAAGSIVSRDIPDGQVVAGNPAKIVCTLDDFLQRKRTEMENSPCFGDEYTKNITPAMKNEMNNKMKNKMGYII